MRRSSCDPGSTLLPAGTPGRASAITGTRRTRSTSAGQLQPPIPETITNQGIHTHGDGIIHIHPHVPVGEGGGASLANFFGDQGGRLTETEFRIPGELETHRAGDLVDGRPAELRILRADSGIHPLGADFSAASAVCNALPESAFEEVDPRYVPQDGDCIRIVFGETGS